MGYFFLYWVVRLYIFWIPVPYLIYDVQILSLLLWVIFLLLDDILWSRKVFYLPNPRSQIFTLTFSSKSFMILVPTWGLWSILSESLMWDRGPVSFFCVQIFSLLRITYWKEYSFPIEISWHPSKKKKTWL